MHFNIFHSILFVDRFASIDVWVCINDVFKNDDLPYWPEYMAAETSNSAVKATFLMIDRHIFIDKIAFWQNFYKLQYFGKITLLYFLTKASCLNRFRNVCAIEMSTLNNQGKHASINWILNARILFKSECNHYFCKMKSRQI